MDPRYASPEVDAIWGDRNRNLLERQVWVNVMRAQQKLGLDITDQQLTDYERAMVHLGDEHDRDRQAIADLERTTGHDLYARLQVFNQEAGHQKAHLGLTSADVVENVQQLQVIASCELLQQHAEQLAWRLVALADGDADTLTVGRTHGRPAQLTTIGKRAADWLAELLNAMAAVERAMDGYGLRGIRGAVGTNTDLAQLLAATTTDRARVGDTPHEQGHADAQALDWEVWGVNDGTMADQGVLSCGQNYPRSEDLPWSSAALQLVAACTTVAVNVRLMSLLDIAQESPAADQVGSSAMPHKTNPRYSERVHSLAVVARGYQHMLGELAGSQWFEGDVSTSAARRIALPGLFHAVDACLANTAYVLDRLNFNRAANEVQVSVWQPFLASGKLLAAFVQAGVPRAAAHETLRRHARQALLVSRSDPGGAFLRALADDQACPLGLDLLLRVVDLGEAARWEQAGAGHLSRLLAELVAADLDPLVSDWPGPLL